MPYADVGIVGAGIIGLTSALCLSRAGYRVTVLARNLPGDQSIDWASPWAGAVILPLHNADVEDRRMQVSSLQQYWALAHKHPESGILKVKCTEYWDSTEPRQDPWYGSVFPDFHSLSQIDLPAGVEGGNTFTSVAINPELYLPWLKSQLEKLHNVTFISREINSLEEAQGVLNCRVLVNATGLGAKTLADDAAVHGVRGQTMLVKGSAANGVMDGQVMIRRGNELTYAIPRLGSGGVVIGGIEDPLNTTAEIDANLRKDIVRRVNIMTNGVFTNIDLERDLIRNIVGFRPGREGGYRIERDGKIIHAYGFCSAGYRYSFGAAQKVVGLVHQQENHL